MMKRRLIAKDICMVLMRVMFNDSSSFRSALYIQQSLNGNNRRGFLAFKPAQERTAKTRLLENIHLVIRVHTLDFELNLKRKSLSVHRAMPLVAPRIKFGKASKKTSLS